MIHKLKKQGKVKDKKGNIIWENLVASQIKNKTPIGIFIEGCMRRAKKLTKRREGWKKELKLYLTQPKILKCL